MEGRAELVEQLMIKAGERVVELGAGTGRNAEYYRAQIPNLAGVELVDLCPALLAQARRRVIQWANVAVIEAELGGWPVTAVFIASTAPYWQSVTQSRRVVVDEWRRAKGKI